MPVQNGIPAGCTELNPRNGDSIGQAVPLGSVLDEQLPEPLGRANACPESVGPEPGPSTGHPAEHIQRPLIDDSTPLSLASPSRTDNPLELHASRKRQQQFGPGRARKRLRTKALAVDGAATEPATSAHAADPAQRLSASGLPVNSVDNHQQVVGERQERSEKDAPQMLQSEGQKGRGTKPVAQGAHTAEPMQTQDNINGNKPTASTDLTPGAFEEWRFRGVAMCMADGKNVSVRQRVHPFTSSRYARVSQMLAHAL